MAGKYTTRTGARLVLNSAEAAVWASKDGSSIPAFPTTMQWNLHKIIDANAAWTEGNGTGGAFIDDLGHVAIGEIQSGIVGWANEAILQDNGNCRTGCAA